MKANNLTISVPYLGCDKKCPYCISKMTGNVETNTVLFEGNMQKVLGLAERCGVTNILVTSKGEPILNMLSINIIGDMFHSFILEIQTNGIKLSKHKRLIDELYKYHYNIIAVSVDQPDDFRKFESLWEAINERNMISRATVILTRHFDTWMFRDFINICKTYGIRQLTLRNMTIPDKVVATKEALEVKNWILKYGDPQIYSRLIGAFESLGGDFVRTMSFGARIYDIEGISFTYFDDCIQENTINGDLRSLIYLEDGHMYTAWDKRGSIIF